MIAPIEEKRRELAELCRRFRVQRLDVFGSATGGDFRSDTSDLDFVVSFLDRRPDSEYADRYLDFADALEHLFSRPVDLLTEQSIRNPVFRLVIESTRQPVYESRDTETIS